MSAGEANRTTVRGWEHVRWIVRWGGRLALDDVVPLIRMEGVPREFGPYVAKLMEPQQPGRPRSRWQEQSDRWARVLRLRDAVRREHAAQKAKGAKRAKLTAIMVVAKRECVSDETLSDLLKRGLRGAPPVVRVMDQTNDQLFALEQAGGVIGAQHIRQILQEADEQLMELDPSLFEEYELTDEYSLIAEATSRTAWQFLTHRGCDEHGRPLDPDHPWNRSDDEGG
jgi:hypothetical protein